MGTELAKTTILYPTTATASSHSVPLDNPVSGNLLLMFVSTVNIANVSATGWTELFAVNRVAAAGQDRLTCLYRTADGTEGTSVSVALDATENCAVIIYEITEWQSADLPEYATATGTSATPDPPSLTPTFTASRTLWFAPVITTGARWQYVAPSNVPNGPLFLRAGNTTAHTHLCSCHIQDEGSSLNPNTWTQSASFQWAAATVAVPLNAAATGGGSTVASRLKVVT